MDSVLPLKYEEIEELVKEKYYGAGTDCINACEKVNDFGCDPTVEGNNEACSQLGYGLWNEAVVCSGQGSTDRHGPLFQKFCWSASGPVHGSLVKVLEDFL